MNAPAVARDIETHFIIERYHHAFTDEIDAVRRVVDDDELDVALALLAGRIHAHRHFQEGGLFPAFLSGRRCAPSLFDSWALDSLRLLSVVSFVEQTAQRSLCRSAIRERIDELAGDIRDHISEEASVLQGWPGFDS